MVDGNTFGQEGKQDLLRKRRVLELQRRMMELHGKVVWKKKKSM